MACAQKLLILDIDETLVYVSSDKTDGNRISDYTFELDGEHFYVWKRPHLESFFRWTFANYKVAFWSASSMDYITKVLSLILPSELVPEFVWDTNKCTIKRYSTSMQDEKCTDQEKNVLIVDNTPMTYIKNYGNAVPIKSYTASSDDLELCRVKTVLEELKDVENVRHMINAKREMNKACCVIHDHFYCVMLFKCLVTRLDR